MNDKILKNQRAWRRLLLLSALPVLLFSSCNEEQGLSPQEITLTRPVIKLGGMEASATRAEGGTAYSDAKLNLYMQKADRTVDREGVFTYTENSWTASAEKSIAVTSGEGYYRAGLWGNFTLPATTDMPAIVDAIYAHRGTINIKADGSFTPDGMLQPYTAAVQWVLKDANGDLITGVDLGKYTVCPVGLAYTDGFSAGADGQKFPNGTADPVFNIVECEADQPDHVWGDYIPVTYPATVQNGQLVTAAAPSAPWPLAEVIYSSGASSTIWTVSYPAQQLTLEAGKLYTFTIGLSKDAHITLGADDISIAPWGEGTPIHVGR